MARTLQTWTLILIILFGAAAGYLLGAQASHSMPAGGLSADTVAVVRAFYAALGSVGEPAGDSTMLALLAPSFVEQRVELSQSLGREAFVRTVAGEHRSTTGREFVPLRIEPHGTWIFAVVQTTDVQPGWFASIEVPPSNLVRRELLEVIDGRVATRIVLDGSDASLRMLPATSLPLISGGMLSIEVVRRIYDAYASERIELPGPAVVVLESGQLIFEGLGERASELGTAGLATFSGAGSLSVRNPEANPGALLLLRIVPVEAPAERPESQLVLDVGPGVTAQRIAQSHPFRPEGACSIIEIGEAVIAAGDRLPPHTSSGSEILIPITGTIAARSDDLPMLRTDAARSWQDETGAAELEGLTTIVAQPGSRSTFQVIGDAPARFWLFAVDHGSRCGVPG